MLNTEYRISAENFRLFPKLQNIPIRDVTYIVGENNSGKSSVIKALLLIINNLSYNRYKDSSGRIFCIEVCEGVGMHLGEFGDMLNDRIKDEFSISIALNNFRYGFVLKKSTNSKLIKVKSAFVQININNDQIILNREYIGENIFTYSIKSGDHIIVKSKMISTDDERYGTLLDFDVSKNTFLKENASVHYGILSFSNEIINCIKENHYYQDVDIQKIRISDEEKQLLFSLQDYINDVQDTLVRVINIKTVFISTHLQEGSCLVYSKANDFFSQTIDKYYTYVNENQGINGLICDWLKYFKIGSTFRISLEKGDFYNITIDGRNVQCFGTGTRQLFILFLRLGIMLNAKYINVPYLSLVDKNTYSNNRLPELNKSFLVNRDINNLIIIEEPEQNLHPRLQYILAEFFDYIVRNLECKILVETHSENLIWATRDIALRFAIDNGISNNERMSKECPIVVNSFGINGINAMRYKPNGNFIDKFPEGFLHVHTQLADKYIDPRETAQFLLQFKEPMGFKYLTHPYEGNDSVSCIEDVVKRANDILNSRELGAPSKVIDEVKKYIEMYGSEEWRKWSNDHGSISPCGDGPFKEQIDEFRHKVRIRDSYLEDIVDKFKEKHNETLRRYKCIIIPKYLDNADIYAYTPVIKQAIEAILENCIEYAKALDKSNLYIIYKYDKSCKQDRIIIFHENSFPKKCIDKIDGDSGDIAEFANILRGYCHYHIVSKWGETAKQINILTSFNERKDPIDLSERDIDYEYSNGFSHVLTFYKE